MKKAVLAIIVTLFAIAGVFSIFTGCSNASDNKVLIYTSSEEWRTEFFNEQLNAKFPDYDIHIEYLSSGEQASRLAAEGKNTLNDIQFEFDYGNVNKVEEFLADLSSYDYSIYTDDSILPGKKLLPTLRHSGCIAINEDMLNARGLQMPTSYEDLLKPEYKGLISMPNPKSSGTGYMFLKSLVNAWGEEEALDYFDKLSDNVLHFTTSGSGPINDIIAGEVAIGFAMTSQAVVEIRNGVNIKIAYFEEGSPYTFYGMGVVEGRQDRKAVREVFDYFVEVLVPMDKELFLPEKIYKDRDFVIENYPTNVKYADMTGNTADAKELLLEKWEH